MVLGTLIYIIMIFVAMIIIIALLKFLFQLFFIAPVGIDASDLEVLTKPLCLTPSALGLYQSQDFFEEKDRKSMGSSY